MCLIHSLLQNASQSSTGFRSGELIGHKFGGIKSAVSQRNSSTVSRPLCASLLSCCKTYLVITFYLIAMTSLASCNHQKVRTLCK